VGGVYGELLGDFAGHGGVVHLAEIRIEQRDFIVGGVNVAANADRAEADETRFASASAADV